MFTLRFTALLLAACVFAPPAAAQEPALEDWDVSRHESTFEVAAGTAVALVNFHGDLRVRAGSEGEVYVLAVIQRHVDDPRRPEIAPEAGDGEIRFEVRYPEPADGGMPDEVPDAWTRRRVDLTVFVPARARTTARTGAGLLEIKGLDGEIEARSERGDVRIRTAGGVHATTRHGEIFAQLQRTDWPGTSELETLTGDIRVELPRGGDADVRVETRGEITTDFSIDIHRQGDSWLKLGTAKIGDAGGALVLKSDAGAIRLIESHVPEPTPAEAAEEAGRVPAETPREPATPSPSPGTAEKPTKE